MAKVVGLDPSFTGFGVAIQENGNLLIKKIVSKQTGVQRLIEIRDTILQYVQGADLVCIEDFAFSRANQAHNLGGLGWIIRVMMHEENVPFMVVGTSQVKKFATGRGNAKKPEVMLGVYKRWGVEFADDNEADAFVLMKMAEVLIGRCKLHDGDNNGDSFIEQLDQLPKFQRQVIGEILKATGKVSSNSKGKRTRAAGDSAGGKAVKKRGVVAG